MNRKELFMKKYFAEFMGTFILVFFSVGTAMVTGGDVVATALAFGLSIVGVAYALGHISGAHVNPAVSLTMWMLKKLSLKDFGFYVLAQFLGATVGAALLYGLGLEAYEGVGGANGFGEVGLLGAFVFEVVLTLVFVRVIVGVTSKKEYSNVAGMVIGLTLTLVHLIGINVTGTSVNPARSFGPALFAGGDALSELWVFIVAPLVGAALVGVIYPLLCADKKTSE
jgi:aquaporin Z